MPIEETVPEQSTWRQESKLRQTVSAVKFVAQNALAEAEGREGTSPMPIGVLEPTTANCLRTRAALLIGTYCYQCLLNTCIVFHLGLSVYQTDQRAAGKRATSWERIYAHRLSFFCEKLNLVDLIIVFLDLSFMFLGRLTGNTASIGPVSHVRALRAMRVIRVIRNLSAFRDLYLMMKGMVGALRAIMFATLLILGVLTLFSVMAVELIDPLNKKLAEDGTYPDCERCPRAS